jgi:hypothetical protein
MEGRIDDILKLLMNEDTAPGKVIDLVRWQLAKEGSRLLLPPIQRSIVWSNEQIINYWDSLLRGHPAGLMLVHPARKGTSTLGRNACGTTVEANEQDFQLFDGQQRMAAVLLGCDAGPMKESRKLWIDFGLEPNKSSGLKFQLRMTSTGQPFGYRPDAPNQKIELGKRQNKWGEWQESRSKDATPQEAFAAAEGSDLIDATCAVSFASVYEDLCERGCDETIAKFSKRNGALHNTVKEFVSALNVALRSPVILQKVRREIVADDGEYIRFFGRVGQGGTRLSDDELTYSIIKQQYPRIHDRMAKIMKGKAGRIAGEVDLVLAALRVAKTLAPWDNAKEWEVISRPSPAFVAQLRERQNVEEKFLEMIPQGDQVATLETVLGGVRDALSYESIMHPKGLPTMLLARLPRELVDVLILFAVKRGPAQPWTDEGKQTLCAFVLHWLLFVSNDGKAAWRAFQHATGENWVFTHESIRKLIGECEKDGVARFIPRKDVLSDLRKQVEKGDHQLRSWAERFTEKDCHGEHKPGEALRWLSTNDELLKRALMWLQREYIAQFPHYDPTSDRDDDLPVDLDHIVPQDIFGFHWKRSSSRLQENAIDETFRDRRWIVGNSLGNFRWLAASDNRSRGKGAYVPLEHNADLVPNPDDWNKIIPKDANQQPWSRDDIQTFQRLIDLRTLALYETLLTESGIDYIMPIENE